MSYRGMRNWPPVWTTGGKEDDKTTVRGEIGILREVHYHRLPADKCYMVIEHQDKYLIGALLFTDPLFCAQIAEILEYHVGHTIKEIGDLDTGPHPLNE